MRSKTKVNNTWHQWLPLVILATQEAEIRSVVRSQPKQIAHKTLSQKKKKIITKKRGSVLVECLKV
jgi:hypothetical protein